MGEKPPERGSGAGIRMLPGLLALLIVGVCFPFLLHFGIEGMKLLPRRFMGLGTLLTFGLFGVAIGVWYGLARWLSRKLSKAGRGKGAEM